MSIIAPNGADNTTMNTIFNNIEEGNQISIQLGKSNTSLTKVFLGVIESIELEDVTPNYTKINLEGPDWGSNVLRNRIVNFYRPQLTTDGLTLDKTDPNSTVYHLVWDMLTNIAWYPIYNGITASSQGIGISGAPDANGVNSSNTYIDNTIQNVRIAQITANYEHLDDKLSELDTWSTAVHYVDPNGNFVMRPILPPIPNSTSGITPGAWLFVDDINDTLIPTWTSGNVGYISIQNSRYKYTTENYKRLMLGLGAKNEFIDGSDNPNNTPVKQIVNTSSVTLDSTTWYAMQFKPISKDGTRIAIFVSSVGVPTVDLTVLLIEDYNGKPNGQTIRSMTIPKTQISSTGGWQFINIGTEYRDLNHWIVLPAQPGYGANTYKWYEGGSGYTTSTSTDGLNWTNASGQGFMFIEYTGRPSIHYKPGISILATDKMLKEEVYRQAFITNNDALTTYMDNISPMILQRKEIYTCTIYAPDNIPMPFNPVLLRKTKSGKTFNTGNNPAGWVYHIIGQLTYNFEATDDLTTGTFWLSNVEMTRFTPYP